MTSWKNFLRKLNRAQCVKRKNTEICDQGYRSRRAGESSPHQNSRCCSTFCEIFENSLVNSDRNRIFKLSSPFFLGESQIKTFSVIEISQKVCHFSIFSLICVRQSYWRHFLSKFLDFEPFPLLKIIGNPACDMLFSDIFYYFCCWLRFISNY
jgi:hypothetical protein